MVFSVALVDAPALPVVCIVALADVPALPAACAAVRCLIDAACLLLIAGALLRGRSFSFVRGRCRPALLTVWAFPAAY